MDLRENLALNLRQARNRRHMTQEELAGRSGLSARYIAAIERADVSASVTVLGRIADALGMEPEALIRKARQTHTFDLRSRR
ncbi:helix-turn-helix domain-containing protein [Mesorhizobium sp. Cs1321R2N1]|uniref:helix-turn-helix domain-containing protein n=1 Tax=Mesorhizobium sp. Cs1321R2N1 TaxID=3015174 RepID=UPI00301C139C